MSLQTEKTGLDTKISRYMTLLSNLSNPPADYINDLDYFRGLVRIANQREIDGLKQTWETIRPKDSRSAHYIETGQISNGRAIELKSLIDLTWQIMTVRGGATSGNWAHDGRPGMRGGSGRGGGFKRLRLAKGTNSRKDVKAISRRVRKKRKQLKDKGLPPGGRKLNKGDKKTVGAKERTGSSARKAIEKIDKKTKDEISQIDKKRREYYGRQDDILKQKRELKKKYGQRRGNVSNMSESDRDKFQSLSKEYDTISGQAHKLTERKWQLAENATREMRRELYVDNPATVKTKKTSTFKGKRGEKIDEGVGEFNKLVSADLIPQNATVGVKGARGGRSFYDLRGSIAMAKHSGERTTVHELGHWLEDVNPSVHSKAVDFLNRRTKGESDVTLRKAMNNPNYGRTEVTKTDKFIHPYMGKQYGGKGNQYATEIVSMGLEMFHSDPLTFAQKDPEYFDFIYDLARGK